MAINGVRLFDGVQATWNLLERSAGPALAEAHAAGLGVVLKEALANGRLTARNAAPCVPQRQIRSENASLISSSVGCGLRASNSAPVMIQPLMQ